MKDYNFISYLLDNDVANIYIKWVPDTQLNGMLVNECISLMDYLEDETHCKWLVFHGIGLCQPLKRQSPPVLDYFSKWENFLRRIERFAGVSIAAIDGACFYFHFQLSLACDFRIATEVSTFQVNEIKQGYLPGMSAFRLSKYLGLGVARRFIFTGTQWTVLEGERYGIIDKICSTDNLKLAVEKLKNELVPIYPEVLKNTRRLLNESFSTTYEDAIGHFLAVQNLCLENNN